MKKNFSYIIPSKRSTLDKNENSKDINKEINDIKIRNGYLNKAINYDIHNRMISSIFQQNNPYIHPKIIIKPNKIVNPSLYNNVTSINSNPNINKIDSYSNKIRYNNNYSRNNYIINKIKPINNDRRTISHNYSNNYQNEEKLPDIYKSNDEKYIGPIDFMTQKKHFPHIDNRGAFFKDVSSFLNENLQKHNSMMNNYNNEMRQFNQGFNRNDSFNKEREFIQNKNLHRSISYADYRSNAQRQDYNYIPRSCNNRSGNRLYKKSNNYENSSMMNVRNENVKLPNIY